MILSYTLFFRAFVSLLSDSDSDDNNDILVQKVIEESSIQRYYLHLCMKKKIHMSNISSALHVTLVCCLCLKFSGHHKGQTKRSLRKL